MEIKKTKITTLQPEKREEIVEKIICDLCRTTEGSKDYKETVRWQKQDYYSLEETVLSRNSGESYPDYGFYETKTFHVCPHCWQNKLQPWLESQGAAATEREVDW